MIGFRKLYLKNTWHRLTMSSQPQLGPKAANHRTNVKNVQVRWRHTIRNCIFWHQSLEISYFWLRIQDSRHFQLAIYTVFHEESESAVRIDQILHPEEKIKKNQPTRVSISYRKISYHTSPPYIPNFSPYIPTYLIFAETRDRPKQCFCFLFCFCWFWWSWWWFWCSWGWFF